MKNLNKVLAFVIVFTMMLGFAVSAATIFPDVADDASYAEAVTILSSLKIMIGDDQGNFNPDKTITRAEVTAIIVRTKGLEDAAQGAKGATAFSDVPVDHWATGYINIASQSGIVAGFPDGTFRPEDPVTYEQVTKMIVAALGYTPKAENMGGYPTGYLVIASQEGISKGAMAGAGEPAKRSIVARLVFNALEVDIMEQTGWTIGSPEYDVIPGKTLLRNFLKVDKYEGYVTSTYLTRSNASKDDDTISISALYYNKEKLDSSETLKVAEGNTNAADLFGYYVVAYVAEDEYTSEDTLLAIAPKQGRNKTITLDYSQLDSYSAADKRIEYYARPTDTSRSRLSLQGDTSKYYLNGRNMPFEVESFFAGDEPGKVTFIDNNNDDVYEYVLVTKYGESFVVKEIDAEDFRLTDISGTNIPLGLDDDDEDKIVRIYNADGTPASFEDIEVDNVLTFANSDDESLIVAYISKNIVTGTVTEKREEKGKEEKYYTINGKEYRGTPEVSVDVADEGKFYLNVDDRIVYKDATPGAIAGNYAYPYAADVENSLGGTVLKIKFLTVGGDWKTLEFAKKVTVYGSSDKQDDDSEIPKTFEIPKTVDAEAEIGKLLTVKKTDTDKFTVTLNHQLFQYQLNSSDQINRIWIATTKGAGADSSVFRLDASHRGAVYQASNKRLGGIWLQDDTIVFAVPDVDTEPGKEDDIAITKASAIFKDTVTYDVDAYDIDESGYPKVVVVYGETGKIASDSNILVITRVTTTINDNGATVEKYHGYQNGVEVAGEASEDGVDVVGREGDAYTNDIKRGDVVIFNTNAKGKIDKIQVLMSAQEAKGRIEWEKSEDGSFTYDGLSLNKARKNDSKAKDIFGFVSKKYSDGRVALSKQAFYSKANAVEIVDTVDIVQPNANINIYEVDLTRNTSSGYAVRTSDFSRIKANVNKIGDAGYYLYVSMYDGVVVDAVVFIGKNTVPSSGGGSGSQE